MKTALRILSGTLLVFAALALAPSARAGIPDAADVAHYERCGPWDCNLEREVPKAEGDRILTFLRNWETFEDLRPKPGPDGIVPVGRPAPPDILLTAFPATGNPCVVEFRRSEDCDTGKTLLSVSFPGVWWLRVPAETADALLRQFDAWESVDRKVFLAEPFPRRYVFGSNRRDGGTLSGVARLFYGDGGRWPVIWEANKDAVPDPDRPKPGTVLVIPAPPEGGAK